MNRHRHIWTFQDDTLLRIHWGTKTVAKVASIIGRTPRATYLRAGKIGVGVGCPQGFEYLYSAASRHDTDTKTLRRILRWAHVRFYPASVRPGSRSRRHVVEPSDVDEAVSRWRELETPKQAADRTGYDHRTMRRILRAAISSGEIPDTDPANGKHWLVPRVVVDALVAKRLRGESAAQAAERVGISYPTLHRWLRDAGIHHGRGVYLNPDVVDRVVEERKAKVIADGIAKLPLNRFADLVSRLTPEVRRMLRVCLEDAK